MDRHAHELVAADDGEYLVCAVEGCGHERPMPTCRVCMGPVPANRETCGGVGCVGRDEEWGE